MDKSKSLHLQHALVYAKMKWPVFPCGTDKKPLTKNGFKDATTDAEQVAAWWTKHPAASIGCPTGPDSGILCLDVDLPDGPKSLAYLEAKYGSLPATMEQNTGSGGRHLLFKWPAGRTIKNSAGKLAAGLDVRGIGGYIILPPSGHPSGGKYAWNQDHFKRSDAPDWLLELVSPSSPPPHDEKEQPHLAQDLPNSTTAYGQKALDEEVAKMTSAVEGTRNDTLYKCGFALGQLVVGGELIREEAENGLLGAALASGLPDAEARKTLSNGLNDGEKIPRNSSKKNESSFQDAGQAYPQFFHRQDGVYIREEIENKPVESWVCSPLTILAHTRDAAKQKWGLLVELSDLEGNLHQLVLLKRNMVGSGDTYRNQLVDMGLLMPIGSTAKQRLDLYLNNSKVDRFALYVDRIGWQGGMFILPDTVIGIHGDDEVIYQEGNEQNLFKQKGTLAEWQENIAKLCVGNSRLVLSVSAAFAAALLKLIDAESGGFHIFGDSSCGKTTTLRVAGSVCGGGGTNGYLRQWRATDNGLEAIAAAHCDSLLCLDEMGQASGKVVSECSYMLANGQGKGRATKEGGARPSKNWRLLLLSTGEVTLSTKISEEGKSRAKAGQEVRVLDIPADAQAGFGIFETIHGYPSADAFARHLKGMTTMYYGTPLRAFLEALVANRENVEARIRESLRSFENSFCPKGADGQVQRACARFGLAAAAGKLAAEFGILPWEEAEAIKAAEVCFKAWIQQRGGIGARELSTGIEQVRMFFQQYGSTRFAEIHEDGAFSYDRGYRMGYRRTTNGREQFLVFPETFRNEICKGFNHIALAKEIERLGHLEPGGDGRLDQKLSTPSGRFYVVGDSILTGEDGEMGKSPLTLFFGDEPRGREAAIETSLNVLPSVDPDQTITPASSAATIA